MKMRKIEVIPSDPKQLAAWLKKPLDFEESCLAANGPKPGQFLQRQGQAKVKPAGTVKLRETSPSTPPAGEAKLGLMKVKLIEFTIL